MFLAASLNLRPSVDVERTRIAPLRRLDLPMLQGRESLIVIWSVVIITLVSYIGSCHSTTTLGPVTDVASQKCINGGYRQKTFVDEDGVDNRKAHFPFVTSDVIYTSNVLGGDTDGSYLDAIYTLDPCLNPDNILSSQARRPYKASHTASSITHSFVIPRTSARIVELPSAKCDTHTCERLHRLVIRHVKSFDTDRPCGRMSLSGMCSTTRYVPGCSCAQPSQSGLYFPSPCDTGRSCCQVSQSGLRLTAQHDVDRTCDRLYRFGLATRYVPPRSCGYHHNQTGSLHAGTRPTNGGPPPFPDGPPEPPRHSLERLSDVTKVQDLLPPSSLSPFSPGSLRRLRNTLRRTCEEKGLRELRGPAPPAPPPPPFPPGPPEPPRK